MPSSATLIERITTSTSPTSVTFSSIPSTYQDLRLVVSCRISTNTAGDYIGIRFNSDTGSNYYVFRWFGSNSNGFLNASGYGHIGNTGGGTNVNTYGFSMSEVDIMAYKSTTLKKVWTYENGMADNDTDIAYFQGVGYWNSASAISSLTVLAGTGAGTFNNGSTFTLWGISA